MRTLRTLGLLFCTLSCGVSLALAQSRVANPPRRDPQALAVLQQSLAAMGTPPADSTAMGKVTLVEGSTTESGSVRVLTRGVAQSAELLQTDQSQREEIFSSGRALSRRDAKAEARTLNKAFRSRSVCLPILLVAEALSDEDIAFELVGTETLDGRDVYRVRVWRQYSQEPKLQQLSQFSQFALFIDAKTFLVLRYSVSEGGTETTPPLYRLDAFFSDYRDVGGALYPFHIERHLNGTPWATILIDQVSLNTGLTSDQFQTSARRAQ